VAVARHAKTVLALGEARERLRDALQGTVPVLVCDSLPEAVRRAQAIAEHGDVVLLAPGCSSFDMFRDYAHRGQVFKDEVRRLAEEAKPSAGVNGRGAGANGG